MVYRELGHGGFGVVYLVYSQETKEVYAFKTFRDEYLEDAKTRELFRKEANVWVELDRHPCIVRAYFVEEIAGRLYIALEYVAPDEQGLNTLEAYLQRQPPDLAQSLRWGIQFCYGMEHAYSKGLQCHRDIKPANIMITQGMTLKISDFGLAGVLRVSKVARETGVNIHHGKIGLSYSILGDQAIGTPPYMPPEQFSDVASCDQRSDIYAFGVVLYEMATSGEKRRRFPFLASLPKDGSAEEQRRFMNDMCQLHLCAPIPRIDSKIFPIICRCLEKNQSRRYSTFEELRADLEFLLKQQSGETLKPPELAEFEAGEWNNKGTSLVNLRRFNEALDCFNRALEISPQDAKVLVNKGSLLDQLGRYDEGLEFINMALEINPQNATAMVNKGNCLHDLGRISEAVNCYNMALQINPQQEMAWYNKGAILSGLDRFNEAIDCYNNALEINPQNAAAWYNKGASFYWIDRFNEAIDCYNNALKLNPQDAESWEGKGISFGCLDSYKQAIDCFNKALELNPQNAKVWFNKAVTEEKLGVKPDAVASYLKFIDLASACEAAYNRKYVDSTPTEYAEQIFVARQRLGELEKQ